MAGSETSVDLSVVVPIHDERDNLQPLVDELNEALSANLPSYEILLVDDGSRDGSAAVIDRLAKEQGAVRRIRLRERSGQTAALEAGFRAGRGRYLVTMDGDLQNDPRDIPRLIEALGHYDAAVGYREHREDPWHRRVSSRIANAIRNRLTGDDIVDTGCSLKAFRSECIDGLKLYRGMHRFLPTLLKIDGRRVVQIPVNHRPRRAGRSKYGIVVRTFCTFFDVLAVCWMRRRRLIYEVDRS